MLPDRLTPMIGGTDRQPPASDLSRRNFLQVGVAAGGGLLLSVSLPALTGDADAAGATSFAPNAFIRIEGDGQVVLTMPYVEMGQGTYTSIPMLIAEELEVDLSQVQLEHAPPNEKLYGNPLLGGIQGTGGSNAIRGAWQPLRRAGAITRTMLVSAAAKRWNVNAASCRAQSGEVLHVPRDVSNMANLPPPPPACRSPQTWCSSDRRISSSSAPQPSAWTRRPRSTERLSMASTFGRRA
jgi:isoquinoline 1-oxidoreductase beta subunit